MDKSTTAEVVRLRQDVHSLLRRRILEAIEVVLEEEVAEALGVGRIVFFKGGLGWQAE